LCARGAPPTPPAPPHHVRARCSLCARGAPPRPAPRATRASGVRSTPPRHRACLTFVTCPRCAAVPPHHVRARCSFRARGTPTPSPGRFSGKPLRAIVRFSHQDAQTPPSPRVGEGGWGNEGQRRTGMQNIAHRSQKLVRRSFHVPAPPCAPGVRSAPPRPCSASVICRDHSGKGAAGCFQSGGGPPSQSASNSSIDSSTDSSPASTASRYRDTHV